MLFLLINWMKLNCELLLLEQSRGILEKALQIFENLNEILELCGLILEKLAHILENFQFIRTIIIILEDFHLF